MKFRVNLPGKGTFEVYKEPMSEEKAELLFAGFACAGVIALLIVSFFLI